LASWCGFNCDVITGTWMGWESFNWVWPICLGGDAWWMERVLTNGTRRGWNTEHVPPF
jgi:hypothetical protein